MEVYKQILEYPLYEISNTGNCRRISRGNILKPILGKNGYITYGFGCNVDGISKQKREYQHRLIAKYHIDNPDNKPHVDHIDGNKQNNNIDNLRWVTISENLRNQKKAVNKSSVYKGVCYDKSRDKWMSKIEVNKICKNIGRFNTEKEASDTRDNYIITNNLGEFFKLNNCPDI
jgi:hypothetical protein